MRPAKFVVAAVMRKEFREGWGLEIQARIENLRRIQVELPEFAVLTTERPKTSAKIAHDCHLRFSKL